MKKLMFFSSFLGINFDDVSEESRVWYLRNYESYFDEVYYVLLAGKSYSSYKVGNTTLISFGTENNKLDLLLAPFRLFKIARKIRPTTYITYELTFSWWIALLIKVFLRAKIYLFPFCIPEVAYNSGITISNKFPVWFERFLIKLNYLFVDNVITSRALGSCVEWFSLDPNISRKLLVADMLPEATPPPYFFKMVETAKKNKFAKDPKYDSESFKMVYVGRLHKAKMVDHLIKMMGILKNKAPVRLYLIGEGAERENLEKMAKDLGVADSVSFLGYVSNGDLPKYFLQFDVFVSPVTGSSFREAALCGLPIVAYDMDWVQGLPNKESAFISVPEGDYKAMANAIMRLAEDQNLCRQLSENAENLARQLWSPSLIKNSLQQMFGN